MPEGGIGRDLIEKIERIRDSRVIVYFTGDRRPYPARIAEDAVRPLYDHLPNLGLKDSRRIDLFLYSRGGDVSVPWRIISMIVEYLDPSIIEWGDNLKLPLIIEASEPGYLSDSYVEICYFYVDHRECEKITTDSEGRDLTQIEVPGRVERTIPVEVPHNVLAVSLSFTGRWKGKLYEIWSLGGFAVGSVYNDLERCRKDYDYLSLRYDSLEKKNANMSVELSNLRSRLDELNQSYSNLMKSYKEIQVSYQKLKDSLHPLNLQIVLITSALAASLLLNMLLILYYRRKIKAANVVDSD